MSHPQPPKPAKLIIGLFTSKKDMIESAARVLVEKFGTIELISPWFDFDFTNYYEKEMGNPLFRRIFSFKSLIEQDDLADIKLVTNEIEKMFTVESLRQVNIDPGYLTLERLVLATGKNYTHRIYIGKCIYADLTLIYTGNGFQTLPWTYPDYASENIKKFLISVRSKYLLDLKDIQ